MNPYCANYYGSVNCHNRVSRFGDRCKLCTVMNEGSSGSYERATSSTQSYHDSGSSREDSGHDEPRGRTRERKTYDMRKARRDS